MSQSTLFFYQGVQLCTVTGKFNGRALRDDSGLVIAQQQRQGAAATHQLLSTDRLSSVLRILNHAQLTDLCYASYGYNTCADPRMPAFAGEFPEPVSRRYLLGRGYRAYDPVLMRFISPDDWSPFGDGGINAYCYCGADPVNRKDPSGHLWAKLTVTIFIGWGERGNTQDRVHLALHPRQVARAPITAQSPAMLSSTQPPSAPAQIPGHSANVNPRPPAPEQMQKTISQRTTDQINRSKRSLAELNLLRQKLKEEKAVLQDIGEAIARLRDRQEK